MNFNFQKEDAGRCILVFLSKSSIYDSTIPNTAAIQVLIGKGKRKDSECDSCRRHRSRILDGLMVQYQLAIIVKHISFLFFYYRF
jgi:hypothetical protein